MVRQYSNNFKLFGAEKIFLEENEKRLSQSKMLEVGVGGGRTTLFFAPRVASYTGIDYSALLVQYCNKTFSEISNARFFEMDARNLSAFSDESFDFILFSFNGIDYAEYEDRDKILKEFFRIMKAGSTLMFSFHNARNLYRLYSFQLPRNPFKIPWEIRRRKQLRSLNGTPESYEGKNFFSLYDGGDNFRTKSCYILPEQQLEDLKRTGFHNFVWRDLRSGKLLDEKEFTAVTDPWISIEAQKS